MEDYSLRVSFALMGHVPALESDDRFISNLHIAPYSGIWGEINEHFRHCFLDEGGKTEPQREWFNYSSWGIRGKTPWSEEIFEILGGEDYLEIYLGGVVSIVQTANSNPRQYRDAFKLDGCPNCFFVRDRFNELRFVRVIKNQNTNRYDLSASVDLFTQSRLERPLPGSRIFSRLFVSK